MIRLVSHEAPSHRIPSMKPCYTKARTALESRGAHMAQFLGFGTHKRWATSATWRRGGLRDFPTAGLMLPHQLPQLGHLILAGKQLKLLSQGPYIKILHAWYVRVVILGIRCCGNICMVICTVRVVILGIYGATGKRMKVRFGLPRGTYTLRRPRPIIVDIVYS